MAKVFGPGLALAAVLLLAGCGSVSVAARPPTGTGAVYTGFEPVEPEIIPWYTQYTDPTVSKQILWPKDPAGIRELLPDYITSTTIKKFEAEGKVTFVSAFAKAGAGQYEVIMDAFRFRPERMRDEDQPPCKATVQSNCPEVIQKVRIGVGVRVVASVTVTGGEVDLGGLMALGFGAKANSLSGSLSAYSFGIDPKTVSAQLPAVMTKIDEASIQAVLQAMGALQTRINDTDVKLTPHIFAVKTGAPPQGPVGADREAKTSLGIKGLLFQKSGLKGKDM